MSITPNVARSKLLAGLKRCTVEADKTAGRAEFAKLRLRTAKAELKKARKLSKVAKKAAKVARKKVDAMQAGLIQLDAAAMGAKAARIRKSAAAKPAKSAKGAAAPKAETAIKPRARTHSKSKTVQRTRQSAAEVARSVIKRLAAEKGGSGKAAAVATALSGAPVTRMTESEAEAGEGATVGAAT